MTGNMRDEGGGIVTGWIFKLLLGIVVLGVVLFEAGSVIVTRVSVDQVAAEAASEAGSVYATSNGSRARTERAARQIAARSGAELIEVRIPRAREVLFVTLRKEASTLIIHRIGPLKRFAVAESTHKGTIR